MKLANITREKIDACSEGLGVKYKNFNKAEFEDIINFLILKCSSYENVRQTGDIDYLQNAFVLSDKYFYGHLSDTVCLKVLSIVAEDGLALKAKKLYEQNEAEIKTMQLSTRQMKHQTKMFSYALSFLIKEIGKPICKKYKEKSSWRNFNISDNLDKPDLVEYQMFSMCSEQVLKRINSILFLRKAKDEKISVVI